MKVRKYWDISYKIELGEESILLVNIKTQKGNAKRFSIILKAKFKRGWRFVRRYDNTLQHKGVPHGHYYYKNRGARFVVLGKADDNIGPMVKEISKDIQQNCKQMIKDYKYSK